jgi:hypothetical protein
MPCCLEAAPDCVEKTRAYVQEQQSVARARGSRFDATAGAACIDAFTSVGDTCGPGAVCEFLAPGKGICKSPTPVGGACHELWDCELWSCRDGVCASPIATWYLACLR